MPPRKTVPAATRAKRAVAVLKKLGDRKILAGYARYGITTTRAFGIPMHRVQALGKTLGKDHALANALWKSGWYEARLLAAYVGEPDRVRAVEMERWVKGMDNWGIVDTICFVLWDKTPLGWKKVAPWCRRKEEWTRRAGFALLAALALHDKEATDAQFRKALPLIEQFGSDERNFVKKGASWALRSVGRRRPKLLKPSIAMATRMARSENAGARWVGRDALRDLRRWADGPAARRPGGPISRSTMRERDQEMLDEPMIVETKALAAAVIRMKIRKEEIRNVMGPAMQELLALIPSGAITPAGRIFSHHFKTDAAHFEFEVGIPATGAVKPAGRVVAGTLPAKRVIRTFYHGGYEGLGAAWGAFDAQVKGRGERTTGESWEIYETGPESGPDEGKWRTELAMVLG